MNVGGKDRPFTELGADEARLQAAELKDAGTFGPLQRVAKVSLAWAELAQAIEDAGAATVGELSDELVLMFAERVWVIPPEQGLIWSKAAEPAAEGAKPMNDEHEHDHAEGEAHTHVHSHGEEAHSHAHDDHDHEHTEHEHEHSHGDVTHSHPHAHQEGMEDDHSHSHDEAEASS